MNRVEACNNLRSSGFSEEQIKAIEGAFTCEDAISREAVLKIIDGWYEQNRDTDNIEDLIVLITYMDSVNPQKPCEPVRNPDKLDCVNRQAVLNTLENMDRALDEDRTVESYKELLRECYKVLPSVSSSEKLIVKKSRGLVKDLVKTSPTETESEEEK